MAFQVSLEHLSSYLLLTWVSDEFRQFFEHLEVLQFEDTPDYAYLKGLFRDLFTRKRYTHDSVLFDWEVLAYKRQRDGKKGAKWSDNSAEFSAFTTRFKYEKHL